MWSGVSKSSGYDVMLGRGRLVRAGFLVYGGLIVVAAALLACAACGKKGAPRAPELAIPERIGDLRARAGKGAIVLQWTRPSSYVDGQALTDLGAFVIFRKGVPAGCPDCPSPYRERAVIAVEDQDRFLKETDYEFRDRELEPNTIYRYRVFSRLFDGALSEPSNEVIVEWKP